MNPDSSQGVKKSGKSQAPERVVAWFCDLDSLAQDLTVLEVLKEKAGLTTLIPESHLYHTSGFRVSPEVEKLCPFPDWSSRPGLAGHRQTFHLGDAAFPVLPGILGGADDRAFLKVLDAARGLGLKVWGHWGLWSYGAEVFPEFAAQDLTGGSLDPLYTRYGHGYCPSKAAVNQWMIACVCDVTRNYPIDGFYVDHARYPPPSNLQALFSCGCHDCASEAHRLGHDFIEARRLGLECWSALGRLDTGRVGGSSRTEGDLQAALSLLGASPEAVRWFEVRASVLASQMSKFRDAVHRESGRKLPFGSDVFPPSLALLAGHDYRAWEKATDFLTGGHGAVIAWNLVVPRACRELASAALRSTPGLQESETLEFFYRLFGYEGLGLPSRLEDLEKFDQLPTTKILELEYRRLQGSWGHRIPFYPPFPGWLPADETERLLSILQEVGCEGIVLSHIPLDKPEHLRLLRAFADSSL